MKLPVSILFAAGIAVMTAALTGALTQPTARAASMQSSYAGFPDCVPFINCGNTQMLPAESSPDLPGSWTQARFRNDDGSRNFYLYVPSTYQAKNPVGLLIMLHGCFQSASDLARQTGTNYVAEKYGFAVLYPEQDYSQNIWRCWNWFMPENQERDKGEIGIVMGMVKDIAKKVKIDRSKIFVAGLSAGGAMASTLAACYLDVISGLAVHSGLNYKAATTETEAHQVTKNGSQRSASETARDAIACTGAKRARPIAVISFHGNADPYVNPINATQVVEQFTKINDLADDGSENNSQNMELVTTHSDKVQKGYKYTTDFFGGNGVIRAQRVLVEKMGHAWSGAREASDYMDPKGPNATEMIWLFLSQYGPKKRNK